MYICTHFIVSPRSPSSKKIAIIHFHDVILFLEALYVGITNTYFFSLFIGNGIIIFSRKREKTAKKLPKRHLHDEFLLGYRRVLSFFRIEWFYTYRYLELGIKQSYIFFRTETSNFLPPRLIPLNTYLMVYRSRIYAHQFFVHILHVKVNRVRFSRIQQAADLKRKKQ